MSELFVDEFELSESYEIPKMGTSGLRLKQEDYNRPHFIEQFAQGLAEYFNTLIDSSVGTIGRTILLGGDPRLGNRDRIHKIAEILTANGFYVKIAKNYLATTPAMSYAIRKLGSLAGVILTASHNPYTDVGIKINSKGGAPALDSEIEKIYEKQNSVYGYKVSDFTEAQYHKRISWFEAVNFYSGLLSRIFDFADMREKIAKQSIKGAFDCMHGAAGPFAREIFVEKLGLDTTFYREEPREDLGGLDSSGEPLHPEPDFAYISQLIEANGSLDYDIVSAWDSDVDRRLDGGKGFFIESADEFALFCYYGSLIELSSIFDAHIYCSRSIVTSDAIGRALDDIQSHYSDIELKSAVTPTGFKWIADLGNWGVEESNGVGNPYIREKDGENQKI